VRDKSGGSPDGVFFFFFSFLCFPRGGGSWLVVLVLVYGATAQKVESLVFFFGAKNNANRSLVDWFEMHDASISPPFCV
jgi:hypothetical protein